MQVDLEGKEEEEEFFFWPRSWPHPVIRKKSDWDRINKNILLFFRLQNYNKTIQENIKSMLFLRT